MRRVSIQGVQFSLNQIIIYFEEYVIMFYFDINHNLRKFDVGTVMSPEQCSELLKVSYFTTDPIEAFIRNYFLLGFVKEQKNKKNTSKNPNVAFFKTIPIP